MDNPLKYFVELRDPWVERNPGDGMTVDIETACAYCRFDATAQAEYFDL